MDKSMDSRGQGLEGRDDDGDFMALVHRPLDLFGHIANTIDVGNRRSAEFFDDTHDEDP